MTPGNKTKAPKAARKHTASAKAHPAAAQNIAGEHAASKLTVLTIGHSTRTIEEFLAILAAHGVERLIDVRSIPKSRRVPQFNSDALAPSLREQEIEYMHMKSLGGLRRAKKDSVNLVWHNASFRGYADYMATNEKAFVGTRSGESGSRKHRRFSFILITPTNVRTFPFSIVPSVGCAAGCTR